MGLFGKKEICCICKRNEGKHKIKDGYVCKDCVEKCGNFISLINGKDVTAQKIIQAIQCEEENKQLLNEFNLTDKVGNFFQVDETNKMWLIPDGYNGKIINPIIYRYTDVLNYELLEDGDLITKGSLGNAVVGGVLFGSVGAIVGGTTGKKKTKTIINKLEIKITTKKISRPQQYIYLLTTGNTKKGSLVYQSAYSSAQKILSLLSIMQDNNNVMINNTSEADEILKYKQLLDQGVITQAEFNAKKRQLLKL